jgi:hemoglobin-like flavoprotein
VRDLRYRGVHCHRSVGPRCAARSFFQLAPDARRLFSSDLDRQHLKLMDMIAAIVGALDKRELFQSLILNSGRQHAEFGAKPSHFVAFGEALVWGLEQQFGAAFTPELKEAWTTLYDAVQDEMIRAAQLQDGLADHQAQVRH